MVQPVDRKEQNEQQQQQDPFDFQVKTKYATLKVVIRLHQQDLNRLIEHLRRLQDFHFMVKSEVYHRSEIIEIEKKDQRKTYAFY